MNTNANTATHMNMHMSTNTITIMSMNMSMSTNTIIITRKAATGW